MRKVTSLVLILFLCSFSIALLNNPAVKATTQTIVVPDDFPNIVDAILGANNGDTLRVKEGTYYGPINQTISIEKRLSIVGESRENTIIHLYPAYNVTWILTQPFFDYSDAIAIKSDNCKLLNLTLIIANPGGFISAIGNQIEIAGNNITTAPSTGVSVNGSYCNITNNLMRGNIRVDGSFNEIAQNSLSFIQLRGSSNIIKNNVCESIHLGYSNNTSYNNVTGNRVTSTNLGYSGISLGYSNDNYFSNNQVFGFSYGFELWLSANNTIVENVIGDSLSGSISLAGSFNNSIYLNSFVDNVFEWTPYVYDHYTDPNYRQAYPNMTLSINSWDKGKQGNYWDRYNGTDINRDGIGDTAYVLNEKNQDNYPLVEQNIISEFPSWTILLLLIVGTLFGVTIKKKIRKQYPNP